MQRLLLLCSFILCFGRGKAQLSGPVASNNHISVDGNKYLQNSADLDDKDILHEEEQQGTCPLNIELKWLTEVSSSVYATPLITDLYRDGRKDIVVPSFVHNVEVLEGPDGAQSVGWPAYHRSHAHASPLLHDIDYDGVRDVVLATYDGEILFFKDTGEALPDTLIIPRLQVRRLWFQNAGRNRKEVEAAAEAGQRLLEQGAAQDAAAKQQQQQQQDASGGSTAQGEGGDASGAGSGSGSGAGGGSGSDDGGGGSGGATEALSEEAQTKLRVFREQMEGNIQLHLPPSHAGADDQQAGTSEQPPTAGRRRRLMAADDSNDGPADTAAGQEGQGGADSGGGGEGSSGGVAAGTESNPEGSISKEADSSFDVFRDDDDGLGYDDYGEKWDRYDDLDDDDYHYDGLGEGGDSDSVESQRAEYINRIMEGLDTTDIGGHNHEQLDDLDYDDLEAMRDAHVSRYWQDEDFHQSIHPYESEFVYVDPHVLCTPNIADIDGDGHEEIVVAVSYFFDREYYDNPLHMQDLNKLDISKYVGSGVVAFDLRTRRLKWTQHLDLSTDTTTYRAYAYASPTLADINQDGKMEVVVGTSMGFLYVLDHLGKPLDGWPLQMAEIQAQALVMDLNNDGEVEILAADTHGNVACFSRHGEELWMRHVRSLVAQNPTAGDINSDGEIEVLFGTSSGHVYALSGSSGLDIKNFPFRTHGRVQAPVLITRLVDGPQQHAVVMSFDGYLYLIDGMSGCADTIDIGEASYSMVLADDLDGNGRMDLLVSTMNGNVYAFETPSEYHPLKAWPQQVLGPNGMLARHDLVGVYATASSRMPRDVAGDKLEVQITLIDKRAVFASNGTWVGIKGGPYNISIILKGVGIHEMNAGDQPVIGVADTVQKPGTYTLQVPCPRSRSTATLRVEMTDSHGLLLFDEFSLSFHLHFHKLLKWLIAGPLLAMVAVLLLMRGPHEAASNDEDDDMGKGGQALPLAVPGTSYAH
ncbi:hypothetical protein DUNSADRAFT_11513 [Dunaliella salina]|uniref:DEX1 C-terminal domain-containing protein n=1 Tax=Dunaliella salina TaxID=3046 RepID=A0ABQ7H4E4_DUNSA|nr:hypothetical protein DUNSADRAFT_11513 [Dunaliella salina]|eukprot:KAF5841733.1 hypothetical protein DUNSADRAFT_11513 [Dunaliella salina]